MFLSKTTVIVIFFYVKFTFLLFHSCFALYIFLQVPLTTFPNMLCSMNFPFFLSSNGCSIALKYDFMEKLICY